MPQRGVLRQEVNEGRDEAVLEVLEMSETREIFDDMPAEVDFSESLPNPYVGKMRRRVTMNIDADTIDYFMEESKRTGVPYQTIINLYLGECVAEQKHLAFS